VPGRGDLRAQIGHLADRQLGHVARWQLLELGATRSWIRGQIVRGYLIPVQAGVYAVGHVPRGGHCRGADRRLRRDGSAEASIIRRILGEADG
jgi:hypothetical protein